MGPRIVELADTVGRDVRPFVVLWTAHIGSNSSGHGCGDDDQIIGVAGI